MSIYIGNARQLLKPGLSTRLRHLFAFFEVNEYKGDFSPIESLEERPWVARPSDSSSRPVHSAIGMQRAFVGVIVPVLA